MRFAKRSFSLIAFTVASLAGGCAIPSYDVPRDPYNQPTARTVVERIQCEIRDMVRNDRPKDPATFDRQFLLNNDYEVVVSLSLEVNHSGGLAPTVSYVTPLLGTTSSTFTAAGSASLAESRDHTFTENIQLSTREIYQDWLHGVKAYDCPEANTNLAGKLGIRDFVALATSSGSLKEDEVNKTVFGGSIQFVVTKSLSATGPTFQLVRFKNVGALASLSEINTDKISLAFAPGPNRGTRLARVRRPNATANQFLQQMMINSIDTQLVIQNNRR
jgi:hypothetical protein